MTQTTRPRSGSERSPFRPVDRHGMTLIELLVSIAVMGILVSLLLMGVQAARQTSRWAECSSNLRQIGIAVAAYESTHKVFPPGLSNGANLHVAILPFIEQHALYDQLQARYAAGNYNNPPNDLPALPAYLCPNDGAAVFEGVGAGTNYAGNSGTWWQSDGWNGVFIYWTKYSNNDVVGPITAADVTDGLSNTFAVSELLRADGTWDRLRVEWQVPSMPQDIDQLANQCRSIPPNPLQYGWTGDPWVRGMPWTDGNILFTLNNHVLTPNQPTCERGGPASGAYTAASAHTGGVNVLLADGRVEFFSDSVDIRTWRAFASRAGGETH